MNAVAGRRSEFRRAAFRAAALAVVAGASSACGEAPAERAEPAADPLAVDDGAPLLRIDPEFRAATLTDEQAVWAGRLHLALEASRETAESRAGSDDVYLLGRYVGDYTAALLAALRATGDARYLDRALDLADRARADLEDAWDDGTTDGFRNWRMRTVTSPDYHGRDVHPMDEAMTHGNLALIAYAAHVNRDLAPRYADAAAFWVEYLETDFLPKWAARAGGTDAAWHDDGGFYKRFTHPRANQLRLAAYLWRITGRPAYRGHARRCVDDLRGAMSPNADVPGAIVWSHQVRGWNEGVQKVGYAQYMLRVWLDLTWDGVSAELGFPTDEECRAVATTLSGVVYGETSVDRPTMAERVDGEGEAGAELYGLAGFGPWDDTGTLLALAEALFRPDSRGVSVAAYALMAVSGERRERGAP